MKDIRLLPRTDLRENSSNDCCEYGAEEQAIRREGPEFGALPPFNA